MASICLKLLKTIQSLIKIIKDYFKDLKLIKTIFSFHKFPQQIGIVFGFSLEAEL